MEIYRVALFGHRQYHNPLADRRLEEHLSAILHAHPFVEFYLGRNGDFDLFAAATIKALQARFGHERSALILVLPYPTANDRYYADYYDDLCYPVSHDTHYKHAITLRNRWMVDTADLVLALAEHKGGAMDAVRYAQSHKKPVIHLAHASSVPS